MAKSSLIGLRVSPDRKEKLKKIADLRGQHLSEMFWEFFTDGFNAAREEGTLYKTAAERSTGDTQT